MSARLDTLDSRSPGVPGTKPLTDKPSTGWRNDYSRERKLPKRLSSRSFRTRGSESPSPCGLVSGLTAQDLAKRQIDGEILEKIRQTLKINKDDIAKWYIPGRTIIHLEGTPIGQGFESLFGNFAMGNHKQVDLTKLEFDPETMTFSGRVKVIHEQSWGTLDSLLNGL